MEGRNTFSSLVEARVKEWASHFSNKLDDPIQSECRWPGLWHIYGNGAYYSLGWKCADGDCDIDDKLSSFHQLLRLVQLLLIVLPILFAIVISLNRCFQQNRSVVKPGIT